MEKFFTKEQYLNLKASWASQTGASSSYHLIYNLLRNRPIDSGFAPFKETSKNKIDSNSQDRWHGFNSALSNAQGLVQLQDATIEAITASHKPKGYSQASIEYIVKQRNDWNRSKVAGFNKYFGLEITEELTQLLLTAMEGQKK